MLAACCAETQHSVTRERPVIRRSFVCRAAIDKGTPAGQAKRSPAVPKLTSVKKATGPQRGADGRIEIRVSRDTRAGPLAGALHQNVKLEAANGRPSIYMVCGGSYPVHTTVLALALANHMATQQDRKLLHFVPTITKGLNPGERDWSYSTDAFWSDIPSAPIEGHVSKVMDYAEDFAASRGSRSVNADRAHEIADVLHSALQASGDAIIAATTHGEVITSFHAAALCNRLLHSQGLPMQLQCTAYFENIVRPDSARRGVLMYVERRQPQT